MGLRILVVSFRDIRHPEAGGAEVILHEIFRRLAGRGHEVHFLTGSFRGAGLEERIDSYTVHRTGRAPTFPAAAPLYYRRALRGRRFDVLFEDLNKIPLLTPLWDARLPVLANVPHLFGTTVFDQAGPLVAGSVWLSERLIPSVYRKVPFAVLSESTRDDLAARGIRRERLRVIRSGIDHALYVPPARNGAPPPVMTYLGRLKKYKRIEYPIRALPAIRRRVPEAEYWIVGEGDYLEALRAEARRAGVEGAVRFLGYRGGREKLETLYGTRALLYTSPKEGWGLSVIEAGACGVPTVASDSPGLCESVRPGETGFLVPHGDIGALAEACTALLSDDALWDRMSRAAIDWARTFDWERNADEMEGYLEQTARRGATPAAVQEEGR